jgi:AcrR family transcriptional regulator
MARPTRTQRDQTLIETRDCLLDAAAVEFANHGYTAANINRISTAAGFAKGTIYNYFDSKRALLLALVEEIAAAHVQVISARVDAESRAIRRLHQFFRAGFDFVERYPERARVVINILYGPDHTFKEEVYLAYAPLFVLLNTGIIATGIEQGDFGPVDLDVATALIMSIYLGSCSQLDASGKIWLNLDQIMPFILDGLRNGSQKPEDGRDHVLAQG